MPSISFSEWKIKQRKLPPNTLFQVDYPNFIIPMTFTYADILKMTTMIEDGTVDRILDEHWRKACEHIHA